MISLAVDFFSIVVTTAHLGRGYRDFHSWIDRPCATPGRLFRTC
jgi:hypothetical protein